MLDEIFQVIDFAKTASSETYRGVRKGIERSMNIRNQSILHKSRDAVFQFPVLISESLSSEVLTILNRSLESLYARHIELTINNYGTINLDDNKSRSEFLRKIHQNDYASFALKDPLNYSSKMINQESKDLLFPYKENFNINSIEFFREDRKYNNKNENDNKNYFHKKILDKQDLKKYNELEPIVLKLNVTYEKGDTFKDTEFLVGVKCISHPLKTDDIITFIPKSLKDNSILFKAIQWTTGEISFFKDLVMNVDNAKFEAKQKDGATQWWLHLKNKAALARFKAFFDKSDFIPNATMIFNISEMDYIKKHSNLDLMGKDANKVISLMNNYFLLKVIAVDEANRVVYLYEDSIKNWQTASFDMLKKEAKPKENIEIKVV